MKDHNKILIPIFIVYPFIALYCCWATYLNVNEGNQIMSFICAICVGINITNGWRMYKLLRRLP